MHNLHYEINISTEDSRDVHRRLIFIQQNCFYSIKQTLRVRVALGRFLGVHTIL